jgi:hypothetical protein
MPVVVGWSVENQTSGSTHRSIQPPSPRFAVPAPLDSTQIFAEFQLKQEQSNGLNSSTRNWGRRRWE